MWVRQDRSHETYDRVCGNNYYKGGEEAERKNFGGIYRKSMNANVWHRKVPKLAMISDQPLPQGAEGPGDEVDIGFSGLVGLWVVK